MQMREMWKNGSECRLFDRSNVICIMLLLANEWIFLILYLSHFHGIVIVCVCARALRFIRRHIKWHACALHCCSLLRLMVILFKKPFMHSVCVFIVSFLILLYSHTHTHQMWTKPSIPTAANAANDKRPNSHTHTCTQSIMYNTVA